MDFNAIKSSELQSRAEQVILDNLNDEQFSVTDLAARLDMSYSSLHRKFKNHIGVSVSCFINRIKLNSALHLLQDSSDNIIDIALSCGFNNVTYFDKCFRDHFGYSPRQVRRDGIPPGGLRTVIKREEPQSDRSKVNADLHNLPLWNTTFIGRQKEIDAVLELLRSYRMVSLVGSGGCGKTRLACEIVKYINADYKDGIWFVDLSALTDENLVINAISGTLNISEVPGKDLTDSLIQKLKGYRLLLILDNCEHLLDTCAEVAGMLIRSVPGLTLLITSRIVLHVKGEMVWRIPSLGMVESGGMADLAKAKKSEAVQLFTDRAVLSDARFLVDGKNIKDVVNICKRVDGIPLALELVASRVRYMDPADILSRLSGRFLKLSTPDPGMVARHKTLHATINWSFNMLSREEKLLFKRVSVFTGTFDLKAVEGVCKDRMLPGDYMSDLIDSLTDRSMVYTNRNDGEAIRYAVLETIRQYADELLSTHERQQIQKRHAAYYLKLADRSYRERLDDQAEWMVKLHLEHNNILTALNWLEKNNEKNFIKLAGALTWFWMRTKNINLAKRVYENIIRQYLASKEDSARIFANYGYLLVQISPDFERAVDFMKKGSALWHQLKNRSEEAMAYYNLALAYYGFRMDKEGIVFANKAYRIAQEEKNNGVILNCLIAVSQGYVNVKKFSKARLLAKELQVEGEKLGNLYVILAGHHHLGDCSLMQEKYGEAEKEYGRGIELASQYGDFLLQCTDLYGLAMAVAGQGRYEKALRLFEVVNKASQKEGALSPENLPMVFWQEQVQKHAVDTRKKLGEEFTHKYEEEGRKMSLDEGITYALDFEKD
ncbi:helix-turn-helix domain-containing protein [Saccharicrinis sp. FJH54]|uniref:helix-turn-helix domain-containing protein n=1 Tax=Saccharicrinis sp. FJH54 TaxID=3344665 RepID=UPI0035D3DFED